MQRLQKQNQKNKLLVGTELLRRAITMTVNVLFAR
jgi:hypothetical protein